VPKRVAVEEQEQGKSRSGRSRIRADSRAASLGAAVLAAADAEMLRLKAARKTRRLAGAMMLPPHKRNSFIPAWTSIRD